ncbi:autotransporter outer membrane beta-barrel domain-containing protein, partial [Methylobacterium gnaphalii]
VSGNVASNGTFANASGATLAVTGTGAYGLAGLLTNAGSLTVASGGSLTAPAGITNSGTITVAQGGTIIDALANTGSVANNGLYTADTTNTASGSITNTGIWSTVTAPFANAGTLVTTGALNGGLANTGTVQASGQLNGAVSNAAGATFALTGALTGVTAFANNGLLDLGGTAFTVGSLSGTGTTAVIRNGALTTGGDNSSASYAGTIANGAAVTSLTKNGSGSLTLTGASTYTGATTVQAGTLTVAGSLASPVSVANGALLAGSGRTGSLTVASGSSVAPGATPGAVGTLQVSGNILFSNQSLFQVDATALGQSDRIAASGTATIQGGTVQVTAQPGLFSPSSSYTILSAAGGVTGRFSGVTSNFAYLTPFLTYDANDVALRLARNDLQFATTAQTRNQRAAANATQQTGVGARLYDAVAVLSAPQSRVAFDALSGEIHASAVTTQFENAFLVREAVLDRLRWGSATGFGNDTLGIGQRFAPGTTLPAAYTADLPGRASAPTPVTALLVDPSPIAVWGQGFGAFGATASDGNAARLARQTSGFVLGTDARVENNWRLGAAGGYSFTNFDVTGRQSSGTIESGYGALYAGGPLGGPQSPLQLRLGATYGGNSLTTRRAVAFAGFGENAGARYGGTTAQGFGELGYRIGATAAYFEPFIGAAAIRIGRDRFTETGGASALSAQGRDYDLATSTIGLRAEARLSEVFATGMPIMVRALVGYRRAYGDVVPSALLAFAGGQSFVSAGIPIDRDALVAQAGLDWQMAPSTTLGVGYTGQVGQRARDHGVKGNFVYRF